MDSLNFCYWLQGYFELNPTNEPLTPEQTKMIQDHLQLVFTKVTPQYGSATTCGTRGHAGYYHNDPTPRGEAGTSGTAGTRPWSPSGTSCS